MYREQTTRLANTVAVADPQGGSSEGVHYCNLTVQRDTMQSASTLHQQVGAALADAHNMHEKVGGGSIHPPLGPAAHDPALPHRRAVHFGDGQQAAASTWCPYGTLSCRMNQQGFRQARAPQDAAGTEAVNASKSQVAGGAGTTALTQTVVNKLVGALPEAFSCVAEYNHPQTQTPPSCALLRERVARNGPRSEKRRLRGRL